MHRADSLRRTMIGKAAWGGSVLSIYFPNCPVLCSLAIFIKPDPGERIAAVVPLAEDIDEMEHVPVGVACERAQDRRTNAESSASIQTPNGN